MVVTHYQETHTVGRSARTHTSYVLTPHGHNHNKHEPDPTQHTVFITSVIPRHILLHLQFSIVFFFSIRSNPSESIGGWEWEERGASLSPTQTLLHRTLLASAVLDSSLIFSPPLDRLVFVLVVALRLLIVVQ